MDFSPLLAISPIDGRYHRQSQELSPFFSEFGLIRYRMQVEVAYFIALNRMEGVFQSHMPSEGVEKLLKKLNDFGVEDAQKIKNIEKTTNHDVKAVEYLLKAWMDELSLSDWKEWVHFGLTSQDINHTAVPLSMKEAAHAIIYPSLFRLIDLIFDRAMLWKDIPMLARTHGQPASPTRMGKEWGVFIERLDRQITLLKKVPFAGKFGGATGQFNAHFVAYPTIDWISFGNDFLHSLGLVRYQVTTQIEHYDYLATWLDNLKRINTILIDFARDQWSYVSMDYFGQHIKEGEVGSSAMPHKVNPIDFENAEGNMLYANALLQFLSEKLPVSRLQRDLTDSTVSRNLGVPLAHSLLAYQNLEKGIQKIYPQEEVIRRDLNQHWEVLAEGIQTVLRREGVEKPYEMLKAFTRGNHQINPTSMSEFIEQLPVSDLVKHQLNHLNPENYIGIDTFQNYAESRNRLLHQ